MVYRGPFSPFILTIIGFVFLVTAIPTGVEPHHRQPLCRTMMSWSRLGTQSHLSLTRKTDAAGLYFNVIVFNTFTASTGTWKRFLSTKFHSVILAKQEHKTIQKFQIEIIYEYNTESIGAMEVPQPMLNT